VRLAEEQERNWHPARQLNDLSVVLCLKKEPIGKFWGKVSMAYWTHPSCQNFVGISSVESIEWGMTMTIISIN